MDESLLRKAKMIFLRRCLCIFGLIGFASSAVGQVQQNALLFQNNGEAFAAAQELPLAIKVESVKKAAFYGQDEIAVYASLEARGKRKVEEFVNAFSLDEKQTQKLLLAANGDLQRLRREVDSIGDNKSKSEAELVASLVKTLSEIYEDNSLLSSVLSNILSPEQRKNYDKIKQQRRLRYRTAILQANISDLEKILPLTSEQRSQFLKYAEEAIDLIDGQIDVQTPERAVEIFPFNLSKSELEKFLDQQQIDLLIGQFGGDRN